jgi:hypothetical protein
MAIARITWVDPTTRVDGSPLAASQIAAINLLVSSDKGNTWSPAGTATTGVQTFDYTLTAVGTYTFKLDVVDTQNPAQISPDSNTASVTLAPTVQAAPSAPSAVTVALV